MGWHSDIEDEDFLEDLQIPSLKRGAGIQIQNIPVPGESSNDSSDEQQSSQSLSSHTLNNQGSLLTHRALLQILSHLQQLEEELLKMNELVISLIQ